MACWQPQILLTVQGTSHVLWTAPRGLYESHFQNSHIELREKGSIAATTGGEKMKGEMVSWLHSCCFFNNFFLQLYYQHFFKKIEILHLDSVPGFFIISSQLQIFFEKITFNE